MIDPAIAYTYIGFGLAHCSPIAKCRSIIHHRFKGGWRAQWHWNQVRGWRYIT